MSPFHLPATFVKVQVYRIPGQSGEFPRSLGTHLLFSSLVSYWEATYEAQWNKAGQTGFQSWLWTVIGLLSISVFIYKIKMLMPLP